MDVLRALPDNSVDSCVTDPPYHLTSIVKRFAATSQADDTKTSDRARRAADGMARLSRGFMGKQWDGGDIAFRPELWAEVLRVLKPGAHLVAFSGTRTYHRMACAIEDAGFEIRDSLQWIYATGFPKSHDVSKGIDKAAGVARKKTGVFRRASIQRNGSGEAWAAGAFASHAECTKRVEITEPATPDAERWQGWGTALKPACEPICLARKRLSEKTVAANVVKWGTGALNIDGCRIATDEGRRRNARGGDNGLAGSSTFKIRERRAEDQPETAGRWPANIIHDGSDEVVAMFPNSNGQQGDVRGTEPSHTGDENTNCYGEFGRVPFGKRNDAGSAARFFYSAKADAGDRLASKHPTVKPVDLMRWLCRLITPPGGITIDPFSGTGTTGQAAFLEGFSATLIEREAEYVADIERRMALMLAGPEERARKLLDAKGQTQDETALPLFGWLTDA